MPSLLLPRHISTLPTSVIVLPPITGFTLMTDRKNQDGIRVFLKTIEGHIPCTPSGYNQFSQPVLDGPADKRMTP